MPLDLAFYYDCFWTAIDVIYYLILLSYFLMLPFSMRSLSYLLVLLWIPCHLGHSHLHLELILVAF